METDRTWLGKVKGAVPEKFVFVTMHGDYSGIKRMSNAMSESELRESFHLNKRSDLGDDAIDLCIETARTHLV